MTFLCRSPIAFALFAASISQSGCSTGPSRAQQPKYSADAGTQAIRANDSNGNGSLEDAELDKVPALKASLNQIDTDGNGRLTAQEIDARVGAWQQSKVAEMPVRCKVTLDGVPLDGVDIVLEPESFLGDALKPARGVTVADGTGGVSLAKEHLANPRYAGVACGWYKIRLTSGSRQIPARYNTQTTLGCEVAIDAAWVPQGEVKIDLKSQ